MAYDLTRCPQNELPEFRDFFYTLIQRAIGTSAHDWKFVLTNSNIPPGFGPGVRADASYPLFGLTQQFSNGPKGRIFLPSATPDENGYFTRCIQYLDNAAGTRRVRAARGDVQALLAEAFADDDPSLVWSWYWVAGHEYAPVEGATTQPPGTLPPGTIGTVVTAQVQAMIDAAVQPLEARLAALEAHPTSGIQFGDTIALRINSGKLLSVQGGGPDEDNKPINLITRPEVHAWESLTVERGE